MSRFGRVMRIIMRILSYILGGFCILGAIALDDADMPGGAATFLIIAAAFIAVPIITKVKSRNKSETPEYTIEGAYDTQSGYYVPAGNAVKPGSTVPTHVQPQAVTPPAPAKPLLKGKFDIIDGLPLPPGTRCLVSVYADVLSIEALGQRFTLPQRRIFNVSVSTVKQLQKQYVSSVGGTIAGGLLLGPLGAIIGGSAKQKNIKSFDRFLIFAYLDNNGSDTKYLVFSVKDSLADKSGDFVRLFKPRSKQVQVTTNL